MRNFWLDFRYSIRTLLKSPGFAALAIITLALGMAVTTTLFSTINGAILRPLPVSHPEQLVVPALQDATPGVQIFSYPDYLDLRSQTPSFTDILAFRVTLAALAADNKGESCVVSRVTGNYFSMLGLQPAAGRLFLPSEGQTPGADSIVVLGYAYWQKSFAGDPTVIGKRVTLNGRPATIIGVAPKGFNGTYSLVDMDLYVPFSMDIRLSGDNVPETFWTTRSDRSVVLMARLKAGVDLKQAQSAVNVVAQRIAEQHPDTDKGISIRLFPENLARPQPDPDNTIPNVSILFMALGSLVLLVACFNVTNVLLVRATARQREMAIRAALGAGRARLIRQYLTESLTLALLGGGLGMVLATWATRFLSSISLGTDLPIHLDFMPDFRVYLFALAAILLTGVIVGVFPALRVARRDVNSVLHEGGRGSSDGPRRQYARSTLVIAQVSGSLVLLIVAGLFIRSLGKAQQVYLGFNPGGVLNFSLDIQQIGYSESQGRAFFRELESRLRTLPGVTSVGQAFSIPLGVMSADGAVLVEGHPVAPGQQPPTVMYNTVSPNYFKTMAIPLHRGRLLTDADVEKSLPVAVIDDAMAKQFWPNEDPIGKRFSLKNSPNSFIQIVGVVQDVKLKSVTEDPQPFFYEPVEQNYLPLRTFHLRTSVPPETLALQAQFMVRELAPGLAVKELQTMQQSLQGLNGFLFYRLGAQFTAAMGLLGLFLAVVGVYSVASYAAAQRTHEIGIRMALGADARDILSMVLRQGFGIVGIGVLAGLAAAFAGTRLLTGLFYGVSAVDPATFIAVAILLLSVALLACWIPARRATRVSPLVALRFE